MATDQPERRVSVFGWIAAVIVIYHIVIVGNLVTDLLYAALDPRIRYQ